jgi:hypothetical protein
MIVYRLPGGTPVDQQRPAYCLEHVGRDASKYQTLYRAQIPATHRDCREDSLWIRSRSLPWVRAAGDALWPRCFSRGLLRETPGGAGQSPKRSWGLRKGPNACSQTAEVAEAHFRDLHADHCDQRGGHDPCYLRPGRVRVPVPSCKMIPDSVGHKMGLPGKFLNPAAGLLKSPLCLIKEEIT